MGELLWFLFGVILVGGGASIIVTIVGIYAIDWYDEWRARKESKQSGGKR